MATWNIFFAAIACFTYYRNRHRRTAQMTKAILREFTDEHWERDVLNSTKPVLVDFWMPQSRLCRKQEQLIKKNVTEVKSNAVIGRLNVEKFSSLAALHGIDGVPTLLLFHKGMVARSFVGLIDAVT